MNNLQHILWTDHKIYSQRCTNVKAVAERFEIPLHQASRDVGCLRDSLGAPLQYAHRHQASRRRDDIVVPSGLL